MQPLDLTASQCVVVINAMRGRARKLLAGFSEKEAEAFKHALEKILLNAKP